MRKITFGFEQKWNHISVRQLGEIIAEFLICLRFQWDLREISKIYLRYDWNMLESCERYAWYLVFGSYITDIFLIYSRDMQEIQTRLIRFAWCLCLCYTWYGPEICLGNEWDIPEIVICVRDSWDMPYIFLIYACFIFLIYSWYIFLINAWFQPVIFLGYTWDFFEIYPRYASDIKEACLRYTQHLPWGSHQNRKSRKFGTMSQ